MTLQLKDLPATSLRGATIQGITRKPSTPSGMTIIALPGMYCPNPLNSGKGKSRHWRPMAAERKRIRGATYLAVLTAKPPPLPVRVEICRFGPRKLDDWDALPASLKPVVDGIADAYGERDDNPGFEWAKPTQTKSKGYAVRITITALGKQTGGTNGR